MIKIIVKHQKKGATKKNKINIVKEEIKKEDEVGKFKKKNGEDEKTTGKKKRKKNREDEI